MSVGVARDPFARSELRRFARDGNRPGASCAWCGATKRTLFTYHTERDGGPPAARFYDNDRMFCNLGCFKAYHDWR